MPDYRRTKIAACVFLALALLCLLVAPSGTGSRLIVALLELRLTKLPDWGLGKDTPHNPLETQRYLAEWERESEFRDLEQWPRYWATPTSPQQARQVYTRLTKRAEHTGKLADDCRVFFFTWRYAHYLHAGRAKAHQESLQAKKLHTAYCR